MEKKKIPQAPSSGYRTIMAYSDSTNSADEDHQNRINYYRDTQNAASVWSWMFINEKLARDKSVVNWKFVERKLETGTNDKSFLEEIDKDTSDESF